MQLLSQNTVDKSSALICGLNGKCLVYIYIYPVDQVRGPYWENIGSRS